MRLLGLGRGGFDHVRINRPLRQPAGVLDLGRLFLENVDENAADDLALLLRIGHALERREKPVLGVHADDLDPHVAREGLHHLIAFVQAQQAVVHENAGQLLADGAVQQRRDHGGIDAAGQTQDDFVLADLGAHRLDHALDDVARRPQRAAAADVVHEALQDAAPLRGVRHLGVKLDAIEPARLVGNAGKRRRGRFRDHLESRGQSGDAIAVAHPHVQPFRAGVFFLVAQIAEKL